MSKPSSLVLALILMSFTLGACAEQKGRKKDDKTAKQKKDDKKDAGKADKKADANK